MNCNSGILTGTRGGLPRVAALQNQTARLRHVLIWLLPLHTQDHPPGGCWCWTARNGTTLCSAASVPSSLDASSPLPPSLLVRLVLRFSCTDINNSAISGLFFARDQLLECMHRNSIEFRIILDPRLYDNVTETLVGLCIISPSESKHGCVQLNECFEVGGQVLVTFYSPDKHFIKSEVQKYSAIFGGTAVLVLLGHVMQHYFMASMGESLTKRVREVLFQSMYLILYAFPYSERKPSSAWIIMKLLAT